MSDAPAPAEIALADWRYQPALRQLDRGDDSLRLKPLLARLLERLLRSAGEVVDRDTLLAEVWSRREVNDEVLSRAIAELRALLGDDARQPTYIETLPKGGYRWIAPLRDMPPAAATDQDGRPGAAPDTPSPASRTPDPALAAGSRPPTRWPWIAGLIAVLLLALVAALGWLAPRLSKPHLVDLTRARPLASDPRLELDPRFDASGRISFVRVGSDGSELVLIDRQSSAERVLWRSQKTLRSPTPSPDLRRIAVMQQGPEGSCELWLVDTLDGSQRQLGHCAAAARGLEWADEGRSLLFTEASQANAVGLASIDLESGRQRSLTQPEDGVDRHELPRLSPDQRWLFYASAHGRERRLWQSPWPTLDHHQPLQERPEPIYGHAWHAPAQQLWIAGDLSNQRALHRWRADAPAELLGGRGALAVDVASDGAVVWSEARYDATVWLREQPGGPWRPVADSTRWESQPRFAPDGSKLALVSNRHGTERIDVVDLSDGDRIQALPLDPALRWVRPAWSEDSSALILTAYEGAETRLYRYELATARGWALTEPGEHGFAAVEQDGRLYYRVGEPPNTRLRVREADGSQRDLAIGAVDEFRLNRHWLVWRRPGSAELLAAPLDGLRPISQPQLPPLSDFLVRDQQLIGHHAGRLYQHDLRADTTTSIELDKAPDPIVLTLDLSHSGAMAIGRTERVEIDLMLALP